MTQLVNAGAPQDLWKDIFTGAAEPADIFIYMYSQIDLLACNIDMDKFLDHYSVNGFMDLSPSNGKRLKRALGAAQKRDRSNVVDNPDLQMTAPYGLGAYQTMKGDIHAGHQTIVHLSNVADDLGVPRCDAMSASLLTWSYYSRGHYRSAVENGGRVRDLY